MERCVIPVLSPLPNVIFPEVRAVKEVVPFILFPQDARETVLVLLLIPAWHSSMGG